MNKMDARRKQILSLIYTFGLILFCILFDKLGTKAGGYLTVFALILVCFFLPFFAFLPVAIEKPLRARISKGQIKNANGLWIVAFGYSIFSAILLAAVMGFVLPPVLKDVINLSSVGFCLPYLAPGFFFLAISRALCMYFQGKGSGIQTVTASALMIVFATAFSYVFGTPLLEYGNKVATLLANPNFKEQYLMLGIVIGIDAGAIITFLFLIFAYIVSSRERSNNRHIMRLTEHKGDSIRIFTANFLPYFSVAIMTLIPIALCFVLFFEKYTDKVMAVNTLGLLIGKQYLPTATLTLGFLSFIVIIVLQISNWVKKEEIRQARAGFKIGFTWILIFGSFISVCLFLNNSWEMALIFCGSVLSYFFTTLLWQCGKKRSVLISMFVAMVASLTTGFLLTGIIIREEFIIIIPIILLLGTLALMSGVFLVKHFRFVPDSAQGFLFPILSSLISGLIMYIMQMLAGDMSDSVPLLCAKIAIGLTVHLIICLALQCGNDHEIIYIPGGKIWLRIGNYLHLFH